MTEPIFVTRTRVPSIDILSQHMREIIASRKLTNGGRFVQKLEQEISNYLGCSYILACNNGTTALMLALHCAGLRGKKVAVTPYTYVATLSALLWIGCEPIFVDIDPETLCMSPEQLEKAFDSTPDIAAVIPVHIYGLPCDIEKLNAISHKHSVPIIYDAAHAFGSTYQGQSLLSFGDYSICSFHATKLFHTVEGGCVVAHSEENLKKLSLVRAFGHSGDIHYTLGINAKMSELHACVGLCILSQTDEEIAKRKERHATYDAILGDILSWRPKQPSGFCWNYAYYPLLLSDNSTLSLVTKKLSENNIYPRRYFYPTLNSLPYVKYTTCPVSEDTASRMLCLPLYGDLPLDLTSFIATIIYKIVSKYHRF